MKTLVRTLALLMALPLLAFTGNKPVAPDLPKAFRDQFATVPAGVLATSDGEVKVSGFLIATTEVSNAQYREFVEDVRASGDAALLALALPDTSQWKHVRGEPYSDHYFSHPAYASYPVVNVSHAGALAYCAWLQQKLNRVAGTEGHYTVRLPERHEWWYAATAGHLHAQYAWCGPSLRNAKGCILANFQVVGDENIHRDPATGKVEVVAGPAPSFSSPGAQAYMDITAPVGSYFPNDLGLYNMNGNVAELLADGTQAAGGSWRSPGYDVRNESVMPFTGPSPEVGFRVVVEVN